MCWIFSSREHRVYVWLSGGRKTRVKRVRKKETFVEQRSKVMPIFLIVKNNENQIDR